MKEKVNRKNDVIIYLASFLLPVLVMTLSFATEGAYPFGSNTAMTGDTTYQFVDYLSYLKTIFFGNNDFVYSLSKGLGGEMAGFSAYYYYSPLNLITLLFPAEKLPEGIFLMIILHPGLCSLSMCFCMGKMHGLKNSTLLFSYAYGLMAFVVVYNEILMYYGNLFLLPLIFLGLKTLIDEKRISVLYVLSLAFAIISNYYTGYMICIFCVLYYIYRLILDRGCIKSFVPFAVSSAFSGGMAAFTLLPALMSLSDEKNALSVGFFRLFDPLDLFSKFYTGSFKGNIGDGLPNIYCSMIVLLLFLIYFFDRNVAAKEKILTAAVFLFFCVNFCINTFNVVWHGFNRPIGFPHRFAFIFSFFLIIKAGETFENIENANIKPALLVTIPLFLAYSAYLLISKNPDTFLTDIVISFAVIVISGFLLLMIKRKSRLIWLLIVVEAADLGANAVLSLNCFGFTTVEEYLPAVERTEELVSEVRKYDDGLYRMEKYFRRSHNDAFMHDYAGLSHFSSSEKLSTIRYMGKLGFRDNGNWAFYGDGNTAFVDCLLGVKYLLSQYGATGKPHEDIYFNEQGYAVFKNPYALPLLFPARGSVYDIDYMAYEDPFKLQEDIADGITGSENDIFRRIPAEKVFEDDKKCTFSFRVEQDGMVDVYFTAPEEQNAHIFFNGLDYGDYFQTYRWSVLDLGEFKAGTDIEISFESPDGDDIKVDEAYIYIEDFDAIGRFYSDVTKDRTDITKITSSFYKGEAELNDSTELVFSVPYDKGWKVMVDSKRAEVKPAAGHLLGINAGRGKHVIELRYVPPGQTAGYVISLLSILLFTTVIIEKKFFLKKFKNCVDID